MELSAPKSSESGSCAKASFMRRQRIHVSASATSGSDCMAASTAARVARIFQRMAASCVAARGEAATTESAAAAMPDERS